MRSLLLSVAVTLTLTACTTSEPSVSVAPSSPPASAGNGVAVPDVLGLDAVQAVHAIENADLTVELSVATASTQMA